MSHPLRAILYADRAAFLRDQVPGSIWFPEHEEGTQLAMWFFCPCGCGGRHRVTIGHGFKPMVNAPSWRWNGSTSEPTLHPSLNNPGTCRWHGWLRDGYWEAV